MGFSLSVNGVLSCRYTLQKTHLSLDEAISFAYTKAMSAKRSTGSPSTLKLLSVYTGVSTIEEALECPRACHLLWLEILVNEHLNLIPWQQHPQVRQAYDKACRWYTTYKTLIDSLIPRSPLPSNPHPVDFREYRMFAEALRFATSHP